MPCSLMRADTVHPASLRCHALPFVLHLFRTTQAHQDCPHRPPRHPHSRRTRRELQFLLCCCKEARAHAQSLFRLSLASLHRYSVHTPHTKGMMWLGLPKLVASVSNAGGLGILTGLTPGSPEKLRESEFPSGVGAAIKRRLTCSICTDRYQGGPQAHRQAFVSLMALKLLAEQMLIPPFGSPRSSTSQCC